MIYLALPYTHESNIIMEQRFRAACKTAGELMQSGAVVFSPIAHTHPIARECDLPRGWEYWEKVDREFLKVCHVLVVLKLYGWEESTGVQAEIKLAKELDIPIQYKEAE